MLTVLHGCCELSQINFCNEKAPVIVNDVSRWYDTTYLHQVAPVLSDGACFLINMLGFVFWRYGGISYLSLGEVMGIFISYNPDTNRILSAISKLSGSKPVKNEVIKYCSRLACKSSKL